MNDKADIECLSDFIHNNPSLEKLESIVDDFNIFTSLRIIGNELRHSNFLGWLLDPTESHGLGNYFLAAFLRKITYKAANFEMDCPTVFEIDGWDFEEVEILREWRNIDILIIDHQNKFLCLVENKVYSSEHGNQLKRYKEIVEAEFPQHRKLFVFLTVEGEMPTDSSYLPFTYGEVIPIVDHLLASKQNKTSNEIVTFISHYREMVKRYIMKDSEIQSICKQIYKTHKRALDLIFEYRPDRLSVIHDALVDIINHDPTLVLDDSIKMDIRFIPKSLDFIPREGEGWTASKRILLFDIRNFPETLDLTLYLGPGKQDLRKRIYDAAQGNLTIFNKAKRKLTDVWFCLYKKNLLKGDQIEDTNPEELPDLLKSKLEDFKQMDLPMIGNQLHALK